MLARHCIFVMQVNFPDTTRSIWHYWDLVLLDQWTLELLDQDEDDDQETKALMFCVKLVNLVIFKYEKRDFHVKYIVFRISAALE